MSDAMQSDQTRTIYVANIVKFILKYGFDGVGKNESLFFFSFLGFLFHQESISKFSKEIKKTTNYCALLLLFLSFYCLNPQILVRNI